MNTSTPLNPNENLFTWGDLTFNVRVGFDDIGRVNLYHIKTTFPHQNSFRQLLANCVGHAVFRRDGNTTRAFYSDNRVDNKNAYWRVLVPGEFEVSVHNNNASILESETTPLKIFWPHVYDVWTKEIVDWQQMDVGELFG